MNYHPTLNLISCETLRQHTGDYLQLILSSELDPQSLFRTDDLNAELARHFDPDSEGFQSLNIYTNEISRIIDKHKIPESLVESLIEFLEIASLAYIGIAHMGQMRVYLSRVTDFTKRLTQKVEALEKLLTDDREAISAVMAIARFGEKTERDYDDIVDETLANLKKLSFIHSDFQNSKLAETIKLNSKSPIGNPGLLRWTNIIYLIWTENLKRTIENKNDGINGRKYLLEFMFDCMQPIHPALEYETLDNMLRKVQRSKKRKGKQDRIKKSSSTSSS